MADQKKQESHAAFYIVMACLGIAILGGGYWWYTGNSIEADKAKTAQLNQPTHPPKNAEKVSSPSASAAPTDASDKK